MAATLEIPASLNVVLKAAGLNSMPLTWTLQSTEGKFSVCLVWSATPTAESVSSQQQGALRIITRKTPSVLRRDRRRQEAYRQKQHQGNVNKVELEVNNEVCSDFSSALPTFCENTTQTVQNLNHHAATQTSVIVSEKSVQSVPATTSSSSQTDSYTDSVVKVKTPPEHQSLSKVSDKNCQVRKTDTVLKRRIKGTRVEYLVKWQDLPPNKNTWVPENQLDSAAVAYIKSNELRISGPPNPKQNLDTREMEKILSFFPGERSRYDTVWIRFVEGGSEYLPFEQVPKYLFDKAGLSHVYRYMQTHE